MPPVDSDFDRVINGFEGLIGTTRTPHSDCYGKTNGNEILKPPTRTPKVGSC